MLHRWLYEIIVCWFDELAILRKNVYDCSAPIGDVTLDTSSQTNIVRSKDKYFQVHNFSKPLFKDGMNAFEDNNWGCLNPLHYISSLVSCKVVCGNQTVLSLEQFIDFFVGHVEVECTRMVEVVQVCEIMIFFPKIVRLVSLTIILCRRSPVKRWRCCPRNALRFFCKVTSCRLQCRLSRL